jgi:hypothetical protein
MAEAQMSAIDRWLASAGITQTQFKIGFIAAIFLGGMLIAHREASSLAGQRRAQEQALREQLDARRKMATRQCWVDANAAAARNGFKLSPEEVADPGLTNTTARNLYLRENDLIKEQTCLAGANMDNGGYSHFIGKRTYMGSDGELHVLD